MQPMRTLFPRSFSSQLHSITSLKRRREWDPLLTLLPSFDLFFFILCSVHSVLKKKKLYPISSNRFTRQHQVGPPNSIHHNNGAYKHVSVLEHSLPLTHQKSNSTNLPINNSPSSSISSLLVSLRAKFFSLLSLFRNSIETLGFWSISD